MAEPQEPIFRGEQRLFQVLVQLLWERPSLGLQQPFQGLEQVFEAELEQVFQAESQCLLVKPSGLASWSA